MLKLRRRKNPKIAKRIRVSQDTTFPHRAGLQRIHAPKGAEREFRAFENDVRSLLKIEEEHPIRFIRDNKKNIYYVSAFENNISSKPYRSFKITSRGAVMMLNRFRGQMEKEGAYQPETTGHDRLRRGEVKEQEESKKNGGWGVRRS